MGVISYIKDLAPIIFLVMDFVRSRNFENFISYYIFLHDKIERWPEYYINKAMLSSDESGILSVLRIAKRSLLN